MDERWRDGPLLRTQRWCPCRYVALTFRNATRACSLGLILLRSRPAALVCSVATNHGCCCILSNSSFWVQFVVLQAFSTFEWACFHSCSYPASASTESWTAVQSSPSLFSQQQQRNYIAVTSVDRCWVCTDCFCSFWPISNISFIFEGHGTGGGKALFSDVAAHQLLLFWRRYKLRF